MSEYYKWIQNRKCEFFPCHKGVKEEDFNCLFCYCPLYMLKDKCGGNFKNSSGYKDCSDCILPHKKTGYDFIMKKMGKVMEVGKETFVIQGIESSCAKVNELPKKAESDLDDKLSLEDKNDFKLKNVEEELKKTNKE